MGSNRGTKVESNTFFVTIFLLFVFLWDSSEVKSEYNAFTLLFVCWIFRMTYTSWFQWAEPVPELRYRYP